MEKHDPCRRGMIERLSAIQAENQKLCQTVIALRKELQVKDEQIEYLYRNLIRSQQGATELNELSEAFNETSISSIPIAQLHLLRLNPKSGLTCLGCERKLKISVPTDLWLNILEFLGIPEIGRCACTCKMLNRYMLALERRGYWIRAYTSIWGKPKTKRDVYCSYDNHIEWRRRVQKRYQVEKSLRSRKPVVFTLNGHEGTVTCLHHAGDVLVTGSDDGSMVCWSLLRSRNSDTSDSYTLMQQHHKQTKSNGIIRKHSLFGHGGPVWSCCSDGGLVISGSYDKTIKVWNLSTGKCLRTLRGNTGWVSSVAFSSRLERIASASWDSSIRIWHLGGAELARFPTSPGNAKYSLDWNISRGLIIAGCRDHTVQIWDGKTCILVGQLQSHTKVVQSVWSDTDSRTIVSGSADSTVKLWDSSTRNSVGTLEGHNSAVMGVKSDGAFRVVSCSYDKTIKIWDIRMLGKASTDVWHVWSNCKVSRSPCIRTLETHAGAVFCVDYNYNKIISGSADKSAKVICFN